MLDRRTGLWRCTRALGTTTAPLHRFHHDALAASSTGPQRFLRTSANSIRKVEARPAHLVRVEALSRARREPWNQSSMARGQRQEARAALTKPMSSVADSKKQTESAMMWLGKRDPRISDADWNARKRELQYLRDPLEVAAFVKQELGKGKSREMLQLVRMASHSMKVIVSWNHIIDDCLARERVSEALKIYNEMKKRGQFPDSYTYTIILRGLSINAHHSSALSHALAVYHSMYAPNSRVTPSIIHTNAALRVCARALDMDALWSIAAKIPENGPAAANSVTYTTILNAIRHNLLTNVPKGEGEEELVARRDRGVVEGRRIWEEIVKKWRNADLAMEEELVCAMGRLLLVGVRPRDWDDVLSLVEQTMDIPRLVPRLGTRERDQAGVPRLRAPYTPDGYRIEDELRAPGHEQGRGEEFLALTTPFDGKTTSALKYATPGNDTIAIVQEACQKVVAIKAANEYWNAFTDPMMYAIVPDVANLNQRLRIFRQNRDSGAAIRLLNDEFIAKGRKPTPGTFRIVMSTCVRDKNNHRSLTYAHNVLNLISNVLPDVDAKAVAMYCNLALDFPLAKGEDLVNALTHLYPITKNLRLRLGVGGEGKDPNGAGPAFATGQERQDVIFALRKIYAVYDKLLLSNLIEEGRKAAFKAERARLGAFLQRTNHRSSYERQRQDLAALAPDEALDEASGTADPKTQNGEDVDRGGRGRGMWRQRNVISGEQRRPWTSSSELSS